MFGNIFYFFLSMSIISAITGSVVLLIRKIKRIPRRIVLWLWIVPFIRMCVPVGVGGKYNLMSLLSKYIIKTVVIESPLQNESMTGGYFKYSVMNSIGAAESYNPIVYKVNILENVFNVSSVVWLIVATALCITFLLIYWMTLRELSTAKHLKDNIYVSDKITSPALYGIIRPRVIIPVGYEDKNIEYIFMHENVHRKRGDNLWRIVAIIVVSIHWFNPLAWVFLKCFMEDLELACDEKVLAECGEEKKKEYALALLGGVEKKNVFASAFGGAGIRMRIDNVLSYKKMSIVSKISFIIFVLAIMYELLTNPV